MPHMSSRPNTLRTRRLDLVAPERPERFPLLGNAVEREARALQQALPDVDVVADLAHRQAVEGLLPGACVEQHGPVELMWIEQIREVANGVGEIHQPILEGPLRNIGVKPEAEGEVGWPPDLDRPLDKGWLLRQR
jgi:hypothetical protein